MSEERISRGDIREASYNLLNIFEIAKIDLQKNINVQFGLVASGSKLLNNDDAVEEIKIKQPEIIGGDMEIAGVVSACERNKKDWIMVKGICDWGKNKDTTHKEEDQRLAAGNASEFVASTIIKMDETVTM